MIKIDNVVKKAVIEKDVNGNDIAVLKTEDRLRITNLYVDFLQENVKVIMYRGVITNGIFTVTHPEPVIVDIRDKGEEVKYVQNTDGKIEQQITPAIAMYTELVTPAKNQKRWTGDFRLKDVEQAIEKYNLISANIAAIEEQP